MRDTRGARRNSSARASRTASPYVSSRSLIIGATCWIGRAARRGASRVDVVLDLGGLRVRRGQRELDAGIDLGLDVGEDPLEDRLVHEALRAEPPGQRLERIALRHPLALLLAGPVLAVDVA